MNPHTSPDSPENFELLRTEAAQLEKMRQQIISDMELLRVQEQNLRSYEARLRGSQSPLPVSLTDASLDAERDKVARLRALLEAERRALVDERLALREEKALVAQKVDELKQREAWLEVRERESKVREFAPPPAVAKGASGSPFAAARNLLSFGSKRAAS